MEQLNIPGFHRSMSMDDIVNHIEDQISEPMTSANASECRNVLNNIQEILLSDTPMVVSADEKRLLSKVNSLCNLLQAPGVASDDQIGTETLFDDVDCARDSELTNAHDMSFANVASPKQTQKEDSFGDLLTNASPHKQSQLIAREDSFGDLLINLPRIASYPKLLFGIFEDAENYY